MWRHSLSIHITCPPTEGTLGLLSFLFLDLLMTTQAIAVMMPMIIKTPPTTPAIMATSSVGKVEGLVSGGPSEDTSIH